MKTSSKKPAKRRKRQYSDEEKAAVLANLDANGGNVAQTARAADVPRQTLESWKEGVGINADVLNIQHVKKDELRDLHKLIAVKALGLLQTKLTDCSAAQLSTIAAISTEKMLLLDGQPTAITETQTLTTAEREQIKRDLRQRLQPERADVTSDANN